MFDCFQTRMTEGIPQLHPLPEGMRLEIEKEREEAKKKKKTPQDTFV